MNKLKIRYIIFVFAGLTVFSCDESKWLTEKPLDFYAPENSYETSANFKQSVNYMFVVLRNWHFQFDGDLYNWPLFIANDCFVHGFPWGYDLGFNMYKSAIVASTGYVQKNWTMFYNVVANANIILEKLETNASLVSAADKKTFRGEALFFRAYYHRLLAHIWGDVPLITEMLTSPRRDFTRTPRAEVYEQCRVDLEEAIGLLADIDKVADGAISKQVAQHLLAEVYISLGNYAKAIEAASAVINHPAMGLMTERFGTLKSQPGDVYYDLFRGGNQNRSKGNREGLLVLQYDFNSGSPIPCNLTRFYIPQLRNAQVRHKNGTWTTPFTDFTREGGGRGMGYFTPTAYMTYKIWESDKDNDIRYSNHNYFHDWRIDNPNAAAHGEWIIAGNHANPAPDLGLGSCMLYPIFNKFCALEAYPDNSYQLKDGVRDLTALGHQILVNVGNSAIGSFKDEYLIRLAETYLLRAEAYVKSNQNNLAADDINVIRKRANAKPASASEMSMDYILDERARELGGEEARTITLFRMGLYLERVKKYNPAAYNTGDWQYQWPIPHSEIEKNTEAELTQNKGY